MELNFTLDGIGNAAQQLLDASAGIKVFAFHGEMGAGKTTLVHAICTALEVKDVVSSPTFSIINQYATASGDTIYHMDLYRLKDDAEAINTGVEDALFSGDICLVEWPEKAPGIFPDNTLHISIGTTGSNSRKLIFNL